MSLTTRALSSLVFSLTLPSLSPSCVLSPCPHSFPLSAVLSPSVVLSPILSISPLVTSSLSFVLPLPHSLSQLSVLYLLILSSSLSLPLSLAPCPSPPGMNERERRSETGRGERTSEMHGYHNEKLRERETASEEQRRVTETDNE